MEVEALREGLWRWTVAGRSAIYYEESAAIILIDPVLPSEPIELARLWRALDRDVARRALPLCPLWCGEADAAVRRALGERYALIDSVDGVERTADGWRIVEHDMTVRAVVAE